MIKSILVIFLISALSFFLFGMNTDEKSKGRFEVDSDSMTVGSDNNPVFEGNVTSHNVEFDMKADRMKIYFDNKGRMAKIVSTGNLILYSKKDNREWRSDEGTYFNSTQELIMEGSVHLVEGEILAVGEKMVYHTDTGKVDIVADKDSSAESDPSSSDEQSEAKKRSTIIIYPSN